MFKLYELPETGETGRFNPLAMLAHSASGAVEGWVLILTTIARVAR